MKSTSELKPTDLSAHLFWDCRQEDLDWEQHKALIVQRVLEYGKERDWQILKQIWNIEEIASIAKNLRDLDDISAHFISIIGKVPLTEFRCYTETQSRPHRAG